MPCRHEEFPHEIAKREREAREKREREKQELDKVTRLLCDACECLEEVGEVHLLSQEGINWWQDHKAKDKIRKDQEKIVLAEQVNELKQQLHRLEKDLAKLDE